MTLKFIKIFILCSSFSASCFSRSLTNWAKRCFEHYPEYACENKRRPKFVDRNIPYLISPIEFEQKMNEFVEVNKKLLLQDSVWCPVYGDGCNVPDLNFFNLDIENLKEIYVQRLFCPKESKIIFIGDIHGSFHSLLRNLLRLKHEGFLDDEYRLVQPNTYMIFTGDYIDRGQYGLEVLDTVMDLKIVNPQNVFLLRGNHEIKLEWGQYYFLFAEELQQKWGNYYFSISNKIYNLFRLLPCAIFLGIKAQEAENTENIDYILCCHGGLEPRYDATDLLENFDLSLPLVNQRINKLNRIGEPELFDLANNGFLWSDFYESKNGSNLLMFAPSHRGAVGVFDYCLGVNNNEKEVFKDIQVTRSTLNPTSKISLWAVFHGHQHDLGPISCLSVDCLHEVHTFISCPECFFNQEGFGILNVEEYYSESLFEKKIYGLDPDRNYSNVIFDEANCLFEWEKLYDDSLQLQQFAEELMTTDEVLEEGF